MTDYERKQFEDIGVIFHDDVDTSQLDFNDVAVRVLQAILSIKPVDKKHNPSQKSIERADRNMVIIDEFL